MNFHIYEHSDPRVIELLELIATRQETIMASVDELAADLAAIKTGVISLQQQIADLKTAGAGAVTQAQLDALDATAKEILSAEAPPAAPTV